MLHPSRLIRLALLGSLALFVRAIVHEAQADRGRPHLLPSPGRGNETAGRRRRAARSAGQK